MKNFKLIIILALIFVSIECDGKKKELMKNKSGDIIQYEKEYGKVLTNFCDNDQYRLIIDKKDDNKKIIKLLNSINEDNVKLCVIYFYSNFQEEYLNLLLKQNKNIQEIHLDGIKNVGINTIKLLEKFNKLDTLDFSGCTFTKDVSINSFRNFNSPELSLVRTNIDSDFFKDVGSSIFKTVNTKRNSNSIAISITNVDSTFLNYIENYNKRFIVEAYLTKIDYKKSVELMKKNKNIEIRIVMPLLSAEYYEKGMHIITGDTFLYEKDDIASKTLAPVPKGSKVNLVKLILDSPYDKDEEYTYRNTIFGYQGWGKFKLEDGTEGYIHIRFINDITKDIKADTGYF